MEFIRAIAELASKSNDLADDELSDGAGVSEWGVEDSDPVAGGVLEVDLVCSNTEAADDDEVLCGLKHLCAQFGLGTDTDNVNIPVSCD